MDRPHPRMGYMRGLSAVLVVQTCCTSRTSRRRCRCSSAWSTPGVDHRPTQETGKQPQISAKLTASSARSKCLLVPQAWNTAAGSSVGARSQTLSLSSQKAPEQRRRRSEPWASRRANRNAAPAGWIRARLSAHSFLSLRCNCCCCCVQH